MHQLSVKRHKDSPNLVEEIRSWTSKRKVVTRVFIVIFPIIGFIIQTTTLVSTDIKNINDASDVEDAVVTSLAEGALVHRLQTERGISVSFVSSSDSVSIASDLTKRYIASEKEFENFLWSSKSPEKTRTVENIQTDVRLFRMGVLKKLYSSSEVIAFYSDVNEKLLNGIGEEIVLTNDDEIWHPLVGYYLVLWGKEKMGILRARGFAALAQGTLLPRDYADFIATDANGLSFLAESKLFSPIAKRILEDELNTQLMKELDEFKTSIYQNNATGSSEKAKIWFSNMTTYINYLLELEAELNADIRSDLDSKINIANVDIIFAVILLAGTLGFFPILTGFIVTMTNTIRSFAKDLGQKTMNLTRERKKTERLLHEILPVSVAEKLLKRETVYPEHFEAVTVYFSDIVDFTLISSNSAPLQIIDMLNLLYNTFDERLELFDVYKVETIGDAYMVASGLPERNGEAHTAEMALTALDLMETVSKLTIPHMPGLQLKLRVGLNTGPVVAGVVGLKMPRYCLFGDTINTASRMMSTGLPKRIQISSSAQNALSNNHEGFEFEERGEIDVKGKGKMKTFFLTGKDPDKQPDR